MTRFFYKMNCLSLARYLLAFMYTSNFTEYCDSRIVTDLSFNEFDNKMVSQDRLVKSYIEYRHVFNCTVSLCNDDGNARSTITNQRTTSCCSGCRCDPQCERRGDCCPDKLYNFPEPNMYPIGGIFKCRQTSLKSSPYYGQRYHKFISKCSLDFQNSRTVVDCEQPKDNAPDQVIPVSDKQTKEAHRNVHCAKCNKVSEDDILIWEVRIKCHDGSVIIPGPVSKILEQIKQTRNCNMLFYPPEGYSPTPCLKNVISECNSTGLWDRHDPLVDLACGAYTSHFDNIKVYKNVFCNICNRRSIEEWQCNPKIIVPEPEGLIVSFVALLDFKPYISTPETHVTQHKQCSDGFVYDYFKQICHEIICPDLRYFYNRTCERRVRYLKGMCMEAYIRLSPSATVHELEFDFEIHYHFRQIIQKCKSDKKTVNLYYQLTEEPEPPSQSRLVYFYVVHISFYDDLDFLETIVDLDDSHILISNTERSVNMSLAVYDVLSEISLLKGPTSNNMNLELSMPLSRAICSDISSTLLVTRFLICPMIKLQSEDFSITINETGIVFSDIDLSLQYKQYMGNVNIAITVCLEDYISVADTFASLTNHTKQKLFANSNIHNIISLVCVCCSIVCLLLTLLAYMVLPSLRTQPGVNNMCLSISLLSALTVFQFGAGQALPDLSCSVVGVIVHFCWLNSIFWMNVCCYHMFITFGNLTMPHQSKASFKTTCKYAMYAILLSSICVVSNVVTSLSYDSTSLFGYGKHSGVCYIQVPYMVAYTTTLPAGIVVLSNSVMYVVVVIRIGQHRLVSSNTSRHRHYFSVYIKLTTITGMAWFSYIPVYLTSYLVFEIIYSVLMACQGIFIMLAFICNKRVLQMLKQKVSELSSESGSSGSENISMKTSFNTISASQQNDG